MIILKLIILLAILIISSILGIMFANKYKDRVNDLKEIKSALNILKTKIEYTYEPLPQIFEEIGKKFDGRNAVSFLKQQEKKWTRYQQKKHGNMR